MGICEPASVGRLIFNETVVMVPSEKKLQVEECENDDSEKLMEGAELLALRDPNSESDCGGNDGESDHLGCVM